MSIKSLGLTVLLSFSLLAGAGANATAIDADAAARSGATAVPATLRPVLYRTLAHDAGPAYAVGKNGCATVASQQLTACFDRTGIHFRRRGRQLLGLALAGFGRGTQLAPVAAVAPTVQDNRVAYRAGALTAWWRVLPAGFEQGFTIARRPAGTEPLRIALAASTSSAPTQHADQLTWGPLHYGGLVATDAAGKVVPSTLTAKNGHILITIDDAHAAYPLTVDPLVWNQQQKVTASDGQTGDYFALTLALEGNTAVIGAPNAAIGSNALQGAVYVFTNSGGTWTQTQKLTASDGAAYDEFGYAATLVGSTLLVGAPDATVNGNALQGAVYVFTQSGGSWSQAQKLTASDGAAGDQFGYSLAQVSADALIGTPGATIRGKVNQGAGYFFDESGGTWSQLQKVTASDGQANDQFGFSAALDGTNAIVGANFANGGAGSAYMFAYSGGTWTQQQELTESPPAPDNFGAAVALEGNTAVIGSPDATAHGNAAAGIVYVYLRSGGTWTLAQTLTASDGAEGDTFGFWVALHSSTLLISAPFASVNGIFLAGAAYVFSQQNGNWQQTAKLVADDGASGDAFGIPIMTDGTTLLTGAPFFNNAQGAAYFFDAMCPQGYGEHDGTLNAGGLYGSPTYQAPAGLENGILGGPTGFQLYAQYSNGGSPHLYRIPGNEVHKLAPAGTYRWGVKAGGTGGDYVLCVMHP